MNGRGFCSGFDPGANSFFIQLSFSSSHYLIIRFWYALFPTLKYSAMWRLFPSVHCCCFSLGFISIIKRLLYKLITVCLNPSRCKNSVINITLLLSWPFGLVAAYNSERTCYRWRTQSSQISPPAFALSPDLVQVLIAVSFLVWLKHHSLPLRINPLDWRLRIKLPLCPEVWESNEEVYYMETWNFSWTKSKKLPENFLLW